MSRLSDDKLQFRIELFLALAITGLACCAGFSNFLLAPNDLYLMTSDALGHMSKICYLSECITKGEFPAWYPYWYNGTSLTQYYPPLSYWLMTPIYLISKSITLSYKIFCFITFYIGGIGVWVLCRSKIGRWCGLFGSTVFCLQPFILLTLLKEGQIAQAPIIALLPWYLLALLSFSQNQKIHSFIACTILCAIMIISHPNTIFMICLYIMIVLAVFLFPKKIALDTYAYIGLSIVFAGILTAFWSLTGVTQLETPGVPSLFISNYLINTASIDWFTGTYKMEGFLFFAIPVSIGSAVAILVYLYNISKKKINNEKSYYIACCTLITIISILFSFGYKLSFFNYLPMAENFMAGRILNLASVTEAVLCAYLVYGLCALAHDKKAYAKVFTGIICLSIIVSMVYFMNPYQKKYPLYEGTEFQKIYSNINIAGSNFDKGRHDVSVSTSSKVSGEYFFPYLFNVNISEGHNIEGTPHNNAIINHIVAVASNNFDYIAKNFAYWNVRSYFVTEDYETSMSQATQKYSFEKKGKKDTHSLFVSDKPSSYFLIDDRNALILGAGSPGVAIEFPYLVNEFRNDITDYTFEELERYKLIYLCEPEVDTIQKKENLEAIVKKLINKGIVVMIEPTVGNFSIFDVTISDINPEETPIIKKYQGSQIESNIDSISFNSDFKYYRALFGLDKVYYELVENSGRLENDIIGTKKVGNGEVLFIGMQLSHYLKAVYLRNWGIPEKDMGKYYPECTEEVTALFEAIFDTYGVNKDFWPDPFPIQKADWNYKGVDFDYSSTKSQEVIISVTYTPRWKATIDGNPVVLGQRENLITINLPAGEHNVKILYGITKYGIAGYMISVVGLLIFILFIKFYDIILDVFRRICVKLTNFLQLGNND